MKRRINITGPKRDQIADLRQPEAENAALDRSKNRDYRKDDIEILISSISRTSKKIDRARTVNNQGSEASATATYSVASFHLVSLGEQAIKNRRALKNAAESKYGTAEENAGKWTAWQVECEAHHKKHLNKKWSDIKRHVAKVFKVTPRSIASRCHDPTK